MDPSGRVLQAPLIAATLLAGTTRGNGLLRVALFAAGAALIGAGTVAIAKESSKRNLAARSVARDHDTMTSAGEEDRPPRFGR